MKSLLMAIVGVSGGVTIGGALAAFVSLLDLIPRLIQITNTRKYIRFYQTSFTLGGFIFSLLYLFGYSVKLNKIISAVVSLIMGTFIGLLASALAEVLNVIPVLSKKLKLKHDLRYIVMSLLLGKVAGSLFYWLILTKFRSVK